MGVEGTAGKSGAYWRWERDIMYHIEVARSKK
jgi:hypothetical protein